MAKKRGFLLRVGLLLTIMGPALITSIVDNDVGGVATYSLAGAQFGYGLLWTMLPLTILLFIIQEITTRLALVTRKGLSDLIREQFGLKIAFWAMLSLFFANFLLTITEFVGMVVAFEIFQLPRLLFVPLLACVLFFILIRGSYKRVEHTLLVVALLYITYVITGFLVKPDWLDVGKNIIVPSISWNPDYIGMVIAIIGTTICPWMQFYQQASMVDKGLKKEDYGYSLVDVGVGSFVTNFVATFIFIATAAAFFFVKKDFINLTQAALALTPVAGQYAPTLFAVGLLATASMAILVVPLSTSYAITESFGFERGVSKTFKEAPIFYGILAFMIFAGVVISVLPNFPYLYFIYIAQIVNGMLLPVTLILMLLLVNNKQLMGKHVNNLWFNVLAWGFSGAVVCLSLYLVFQPVIMRVFFGGA